MDGLNSGVERTEERISKLEDRIENIQSGQQRENRIKTYKQVLRNLWDYNIRSNIRDI